MNKRVILIAAGLIASSGARGDWINVKNWSTNAALNATGNGVTNDAPRIQAAIDTIANGAILYFPAGTYRLGATTNSSSNFPFHHALRIFNKGLTIVGDGSSSVLLQTNPATTLIFAYLTNHTDSFAIRNIKLQGDTNAPTTHKTNMFDSGCLLAVSSYGAAGTVFSGYSNGPVRIENVEFDDHGKRIALLLDGLQDVTVDGCRFIHYRHSNRNRGRGHPSIAVGWTGVGSLRLVNNYDDADASGGSGLGSSVGGEGFYLQAGLSVIVSGNTMLNSKVESILSGFRHTIVRGNIVRSFKLGANGIAIWPNPVWTGTNIQAVITDNVAEGLNGFVSTGSMSDTNAVKIDATIANNTARLARKEQGVAGIGAGITWARGRRLSIHGNTIDNYGYSAVWAVGTGLDDSEINIQGNTFTTHNNRGGGCAIVLNRGDTGRHNYFYRNIRVLNNFISGGADGHLVVDRAAIPAFGPAANVPGKLLIGNNIYADTRNLATFKRVRVDSTNVVTATTNLGGYSVVDQGP